MRPLSLFATGEEVGLKVFSGVCPPGVAGKVIAIELFFIIIYHIPIWMTTQTIELSSLLEDALNVLIST